MVKLQLAQMMLDNRRSNIGFTLIEILVAVAILAIALTAVIRVIGVAVNNEQHLQQKTVAHWVAMNVLAEARTGVILTPAAGGVQAGENSILGKVYLWQLTAETVPGLPVLKITVRVFDHDKKNSLEVLQTFVQNPGVNNVSQ